MEYREYKELYIGEDSKDKLIRGIERLAEAVLVTMGPAGRTVIIQDEYGKPYVTKDGVSVSNAIKFKHPIENMGAKLIKEVAQKTADEAGDGTTTSICLALAFIRQGMELLSNECSTKDLHKAIDDLVELVLIELKKKSKLLNRKDINKVATISANGDSAIGEIIQKAYNHSDIVKVEEGKNKNDEVKIVDGMSLPTTYFSSAFINTERKNEVNYEDAKVLVLDKKLENFNHYGEVMKYCSNQDIPLVIFTEHISEAALKLLESNVYNKAIKAVVIKAPGFGQYRKDHLRDIASFTGATVITNDKAMMINGTYLGDIKKISVGRTNTVITKADNIDLTEKIKELKEASKSDQLNDYDREFIINRMNNLTGKLSIIKVGGSSEVEMKERKDRIDDAVLAVKSALEEGIIEGGGLSFLKVYDKLINRKSKNLNYVKGLLPAILAPSCTIYDNSEGSINPGVNDNYFKKNIVDPFKVARCALENSASVAKTILSTEAVVLNEQLWN